MDGLLQDVRYGLRVLWKSRIYTFVAKVLRRSVSRREMERRQAADQHTIQFLGKWLRHVAGAKAGFDVTHGNARVKSGERSTERRGSVALHNDPVGTFARDHVFESRDDSRCRLEQALAGLHQIQIVIRTDGEGRQDLIEKITMLRRYRDTCFERASLLDQAAHHRSKLDRLRAGAEDK